MAVVVARPPSRCKSISGFVLSILNLWKKEGAAEVLDHYSLATELDPAWYQAWHAWALANFDVITELEVSPEGLTADHFPTYIIPAVESESISWMFLGTQADSF